MSHETLREKVIDLALGALDPGEAREAEAHAAACAECRRELASLRATRAAMAALPPLPAPERGEAVLLAAARQAAEEAAERRPRLLQRWRWAAALGVASATAAVLVTLQRSGAPTASRFDEGRDALAMQAPASAPIPAAAPAPLQAPAAPPEAFARAEEAAPPPAPRKGTAPLPPGGSGAAGAVGGIAELRDSGVAEAMAAKEEHARESRAQAAPALAAAEEVPARAKKASDQDRRAGPVASLRAVSAEVASAEAAGRASAGRAEEEAATVAEAKALAPSPAAAPPRMAPPATGAGPACPGERSRTLERDAAGRLVRRVRAGTLAGRAYWAEERYGPDGRLSGVTVVAEGREVPVRAGDLEPLPGLRLAATAAEAEAAPPACGP